MCLCHPSLLAIVLSASFFAGCTGTEDTHAARSDAPPVIDLPEDAGAVPMATRVAPPERDAWMPRREKLEINPSIGLGLDCTTDLDHAKLLGCTGLYLDWHTKALGVGVKEFDPVLHL